MRRLKSPDAPLTYVSLGGSNTIGNGVRRNETFPTLTALALKKSSGMGHFVNSGIGAMGPMLPATCASKYIPPSVEWATVEYLPNMGHAAKGGSLSDRSELAAVDKMLTILVQARAAKVVVVNIVPSGFIGSCPGCVRPSQSVRLLRAMENLTAAHGLPNVTVDARMYPWLFDSFKVHLNPAGHMYVHQQLMRLYATFRFARTSPPRNGTSPEDIGVTCLVGEELQEAVGRARGFRPVDQAKPGQARKVLWEARDMGSTLALKLRLPPAAEARPKKATGKPPRPYLVSVGLQISHARNLPLFGAVNVSCHHGCTCECVADNEPECSFDALTQRPVTVTSFVTLWLNAPSGSAGPGDCTLRISNRADAAAERYRAAVRALVFGTNDWRMKWVNHYHLQHAGMTQVRL